MKIFTIYLLIASTLVAPIAWAMDTHESAIQGHTNATLEQAANETLDRSDSHDADQSDHCDHGIAHLITLVSYVRSSLRPPSNNVSSVWDNTFPTLALNPPYRPPIL